MVNYRINANIGSEDGGKMSPGMVPQETLLLGEGQCYCKDGIKKSVNNNALVVGATGSGKTRGLVMMAVYNIKEM